MDARTAAGVASRWARIWWRASTPLVGEQPGNRSNNSSVTTVLLTMLPWVAGVQRWQRGALGVGTVGCPLRSVTVRPCAWSQCGPALGHSAAIGFKTRSTSEVDSISPSPILDQRVSVEIDPAGQKCEFVCVEIAILQTDGWPDCYLHRF